MHHLGPVLRPYTTSHGRRAPRPTALAVASLASAAMVAAACARPIERERSEIVARVERFFGGTALETANPPETGTYARGVKKIVVQVEGLAPLDRSFDVAWPSPPRPLRGSDVERYVPLVSLVDPAPTDVTLWFRVMDDPDWWWDGPLGFVQVAIAQGAREPSREGILTYAAWDPSSAPEGAPIGPIVGYFGLGCTEAGEIAGSDGVAGELAYVYLDGYGLADTHGYAWEYERGRAQSDRFDVRCR